MSQQIDCLSRRGHDTVSQEWSEPAVALRSLQCWSLPVLLQPKCAAQPTGHDVGEVAAITASAPGSITDIGLRTGPRLSLYARCWGSRLARLGSPEWPQIQHQPHLQFPTQGTVLWRWPVPCWFSCCRPAACWTGCSGSAPASGRRSSHVRRRSRSPSPTGDPCSGLTLARG
jgi:hypothetical protein